MTPIIRISVALFIYLDSFSDKHGAIKKIHTPIYLCSTNTKPITFFKPGLQIVAMIIELGGT